MRPLFFVLLVSVLATALCQGEARMDPTEHLVLTDNENLHMQGFSSINEPSVSQVNIITTQNAKERPFYKLMIWLNLILNALTAQNVLKGYQKNRLCLTFSVVLIFEQFFVGILHMQRSALIRSSLFLKIFYYAILWFIQSDAFSQIKRVKRLQKKQNSILILYGTIQLLLGFYSYQLFEYINLALFIFSPIIHLYDLQQKQKTIDFKTITTDDFIFYSLNVYYLIFALFRYSQIYFKRHSQNSIVILMCFALFICLFYVIFVIVPEVKAQWVLVSRRLINRIKVLLEMTLQEQECVICLQNMDHFADLYERFNHSKTSKDSDLYESECGHIFHNQCIIEWSNTKDTCPLCNCTLRE